MSSVPAGKRSWKCPECGGESLLSIAQLDPIACEACLTKMKDAGKSAGVPNMADAVAGPLGMWATLPETTKLGAVGVALILGLAIGYFGAKSTLPPAGSAANQRHRTAEPTLSHEKSIDEPTHSHEKSTDDDVTTEKTRPDPPGPGYKWVSGRTRKDGTRGEGHWVKK